MPSFKSFDNTSIYYDFKQGREPISIIILHGWLANSEYYEMLYPYFQDFNIINWDARCHGKSQVSLNASIDDLAKDFDFFLSNIYTLPYPVVAMGHSMGALTLMNYIMLFGCENIHKLIFIDQSPKLKTDKDWDLGIYGNYDDEKEKELLKAFEEDLGAGVMKLSGSGLNKKYNQFVEKNYQTLFKRRRLFSDQQKYGLINIWKTLTSKDFRPALASIDIPTLLLYGEKSQFYLKETGMYMKNHIKDSKLIYLKEGDHSPFLQDTQNFVDSIIQFIKEE